MLHLCHIFGGADPLILFKNLTEMVGILKAGEGGHLLDRKDGMELLKLTLGIFDAQLVKILDGRLAGDFLKYPPEISFAKACVIHGPGEIEICIGYVLYQEISEGLNKCHIFLIAGISADEQLNHGIAQGIGQRLGIGDIFLKDVVGQIHQMEKIIVGVVAELTDFAAVQGCEVLEKDAGIGEALLGLGAMGDLGRDTYDLSRIKGIFLAVDELIARSRGGQDDFPVGMVMGREMMELSRCLIDKDHLHGYVLLNFIAYIYGPTKSTRILQISLLVPTRILGPQMPSPEVTMLCIFPFLR